MQTIVKVRQLFSAAFRPIKVETNEIYIDEHYAQAVADHKATMQARAVRLVALKKRRVYFKYFNVRERYGISFKVFNTKVDRGTWEPVMADMN